MTTDFAPAPTGRRTRTLAGCAPHPLEVYFLRTAPRRFPFDSLGIIEILAEIDPMRRAGHLKRSFSSACLSLQSLRGGRSTTFVSSALDTGTVGGRRQASCWPQAPPWSNPSMP